MKVYNEQNKPLSGSELSRLYPTPKTPHEQYVKSQKAQEYRRQLRPKFTLLTATFTLMIIFAVSINAIGAFDAIVGIVGVISGVFFFILLALAVFAAFLWQFSRITTYFEDRGLRAWWFVWMYIFVGTFAAWVHYTYFSSGGIVAQLGVSSVFHLCMLVCGLLYSKLYSLK